jgi:hypothetical protein
VTAREHLIWRIATALAFLAVPFALATCHQAVTP